jgi:hypothetical protein
VGCNVYGLCVRVHTLMHTHRRGEAGADDHPLQPPSRLFPLVLITGLS